jgi:hypothetical protein
MAERWEKFPLLQREWVVTVRTLNEDSTIILFILHINHMAGSKLSDSGFTACSLSYAAPLPG